MQNTVKKTSKKKSELDNTVQWENGSLGTDENFVRVSNQGTEERLDEGLNLQMVSLRLPKSAVDELKIIAHLNGLGYQPFIRQILMNYLNGQKEPVNHKRKFK